MNMGNLGSGRGVRGGGTADKLGRTSEQQKHGKKIASPLSKTPEWSGLPKKNKGTLKPGHHGVVKGYKTP
jgi:hypothetical protein